jgi:hypothetical protein
VLQFEDGALSHALVKVPMTELVQWDVTHDDVGRQLAHVLSDEVKDVKNV